MIDPQQLREALAWFATFQPLSKGLPSSKHEAPVRAAARFALTVLEGGYVLIPKADEATNQRYPQWVVDRCLAWARSDSADILDLLDSLGDGPAALLTEGEWSELRTVGVFDLPSLLEGESE